MDESTRKATERFQELFLILKRLRAPDGCPWDRKQTCESMAPRILEEAFEVADAVDSGVSSKMSEELGDLSMNVFLTCLIAEEAGRFDTEEVLKKIAVKLIGRHPHVFGDAGPLEEERFLKLWEELKRRERQENNEDTSLVAGVPRAMPALLRGLRLAEKLRRASERLPLFRNVEQRVRDGLSRDLDEERMGALLLDLVVAAAERKIDPERALRRRLNLLEETFRRVEDTLQERLGEAGADEIDPLWNA
jgi:tetrapyrrole methylase family protein/MazG family protein